MKHEVTTLHTKKAFSVSLKKHMAKKQLSKITVSEIVEDCGVNRKTFYYHFADIFELLKWTLEEEAVEVVKQFTKMLSYEDAILFVLDYVEENEYILNCAYDSMGRDELKRFLYADFIEITHSLVENLENTLNCYINNDYRDFVCSFYSEAIGGMLVDWLRDRTVRDRDKVLHYLSNILKSSIPQVLLLASKSDTNTAN
ncbi:TetR/AcrR family transcriptional regulator [Peptostreptococcaceae bacterium OttesenSCG-928-C18]|nr:TetR/AcrR family transcriptional regulator [Peptostreptococcaceae bacterium OttesenSCG-928-C18]